MRTLGPYSLEQEIGRGGAGVVYRARSPDGRVVAIKALLDSSPEKLARFERERRLQAALGESEGFVPLLDAGRDPGGAPYLVMPFVGGGSLRDELESGTVGIPRAIEVGVAVARALGAAHERGIVHRDLKPENVLFLARRGRPLIADLGLAKHFSADKRGASQSLALSRSGAFMGTVGYMAPEQVLDPSSVSAAADVFAIGAVLYECLAGRPAFRADSVVEALAEIGRCQPPPLASLRADAPDWLVRVVERCLSREPAERFEDGEALARALEQAEPDVTRTPRTFAVVVASFAAIIIIATAATFAITGTRPASPSPSPSESASASVFRERGAALRAKRLNEASLRELDRACALDVRDARSFAERARTRNVLGQGELAIADADRALELDPSSADALAARGEARLVTKDARGKDDLDRAVAAAPRTAWIVEARSRLSGTIEEQLADATRALELEPGVASFWATRSGHRINKGDLEGAIADATRAIELDSTFAWGYGRRGDAEMLANDNERADADLTRAIALEPDDFWFWLYRGSLRLRQGDTGGAIADSNEAIRVNARCYGTVYLTLFAAHLKRGEKSEARADLVKALESDVDATTKDRVRQTLAQLDGEK